MRPVELWVWSKNKTVSCWIILGVHIILVAYFHKPAATILVCRWNSYFLSTSQPCNLEEYVNCKMAIQSIKISVFINSKANLPSATPTFFMHVSYFLATPASSNDKVTLCLVTSPYWVSINRGGCMKKDTRSKNFKYYSTSFFDLILSNIV